MAEADARQRLENQESFQEARLEFHAALSACERQAEHARDALYQENLNQAHIHFETGAGACDRAVRAKAKLDRALSRLANAVPYA